MTNGLLAHNIYLALAYILSAKLCQSFAIEPGNVTPIWLASGICYTWVYVKGYRVLPGVFFGAFIGNTSAYAFSQGAPTPFLTLLAGSLNGLGDVLCIWFGIALMRAFAPGNSILDNVKSSALFVVGPVIIGSMISALFGVTGLWVAGLVPTDSYFTVFQTWTVGDFMGILLLVPFLESLFVRKLNFSFKAKAHATESFACLALATILIYLAIRYDGMFLSHFSLFSLVPILTLYSVRQQESVITATAFLIGMFAIGMA